MNRLKRFWNILLDYHDWTKVSYVVAPLLFIIIATGFAIMIGIGWILVSLVFLLKWWTLLIVTPLVIYRGYIVTGDTVKEAWADSNVEVVNEKDELLRPVE